MAFWLRKAALIAAIAIAASSAIAQTSRALGSEPDAGKWASAAGIVLGTEPLPPDGRIVADASLAWRWQVPTRASLGAAPLAIKHWSGQFSDGGTVYTYKMLGENPAKAGAGATTISIEIIPVAFAFTNVTLDPTAAGPCSPQSAVRMIAQSPLVLPHPLVLGGTDVGASQYIDQFQRANFWAFTNPAGVNPNYHVVFKFTQGPVMTLQVAGEAKTTDFCGQLGKPGGFLGNVKLRPFLDVVRAAAATITAQDPSVVPYFVTYDTIFGGAGGIHLSDVVGGHRVLFGVAAYVDSSFSTADVEILSHELAEMVDDPSGRNMTPRWGHVGQVAGCQETLEVGDPLTTSPMKISMPSGFSYSVQELAFLSWFSRDAVSSGVNGWYSDFGTFRSPAAICQ